MGNYRGEISVPAGCGFDSEDAEVREASVLAVKRIIEELEGVPSAAVQGVLTSVIVSVAAGQLDPNEALLALISGFILGLHSALSSPVAGNA